MIESPYTWAGDVNLLLNSYFSRALALARERSVPKNYLLILFVAWVFQEFSKPWIISSNINKRVFKIYIWILIFYGQLFCLLYYVYAKLLQLFLTLCDPIDCSAPNPSVHGILQARILEWIAMPFSRGSSQPRGKTCISYVSCIGKWVLYH